MKAKELFISTDLWIAMGLNDIRAVKGAFMDDMHIHGECAYDRYKIVKNCNFLPTTCNDLALHVRLRPKQTVVVFYKNDQPVRLLAVNGQADLQGMINMAMVERIGRVSLQRIFDERGITCSEVDLKEDSRDVVSPIVLEEEIGVFSCNRWSLFQAALAGRTTDHPADDEDAEPSNPDTVPELEYHPNLVLTYQLTTDTEHFTIRHQGAFYDKSLTYLVAPQIGSELSP